jgi:hypothetical protein
MEKLCEFRKFYQGSNNVVRKFKRDKECIVRMIEI